MKLNKFQLPSYKNVDINTSFQGGQMPFLLRSLKLQAQQLVSLGSNPAVPY